MVGIIKVGKMYGWQNGVWHYVWQAKCTVGKMYGRQNVVAPRNVYLSGQISKIMDCVNLK